MTDIKQKIGELTTNSFVDQSPVAAQLKQGKSLLEQSQLGSATDLAGSLGTAKNQINGDVSSAISRIGASQRGEFNNAVAIAGQLENSGVAAGVARSFLNKNFKPAAAKKVGIDQGVVDTAIDLTLKKNRVPDKNKLQPFEKMSEARESLVGQLDFGYAGLQFPADLIGTAHTYLQLMFEEYIRPAPDQPGELSPNTFIYLPIPDNFQEAFNVRYKPSDTGALGEVRKFLDNSGAIESLRQGEIGGATGDIFSALGEEGMSGVGDILMTAAKRTAMTSISESEPALGGLIGQAAGMIPNPHPTIFFEGLDLRQFEWSWKLIPRTPADAEQIQQIIKIMKQKILPKKSGTWLKYPNLVKCDVLGQGAGKMGTFQRSLVSSLAVNYTGEGTSAYFRDGNPVSIILSMQFQEIENFTADQVK